MPDHNSFLPNSQSIPQPPYKRIDLLNPQKRDQISQVLKNKSWEMTVGDNTLSSKGYCFLKHKDFPDGVFLPGSSVLKGLSLRKGQIIKVFVQIKMNFKRGDFGFVANFHEKVQTSKQEQSPQPRAVLERRLKILPTETALKDLQNQEISIGRASSFGMTDSFMTIYLDEGWPPVSNPSAQKRKGVIGGIVWRGFQPDDTMLPRIKTHVRGSVEGIQALRRLLACEKAFPFVMPIEGRENVPEKEYFDFVVSAVKLLLGWLLPQQGSRCKLRILLEQIGDMKTGTDRTAFLNGVIGEARFVNSHRFSRWNIETVKWCEKNEEYIPYADLVCYLSDERSEICKEMGAKADYRNWPGYLPLSLDLVSRLTRLDQFELSKNVDDVLDVSSSTYGTELYRVMIDDLAVRFTERVDLQRNLVETLEKRYEAKNRDLNSLRKQTSAARQLVKADNENLPMRVQLLWSLIDLQEANHHGDPVKAVAAVEKYLELRPKTRPHDPELIVFADLNFAVHLNDQFRFEEALAVNRSLVEDSGFAHLSVLAQGRALSSLGQSHSFLRRHDESESCFAKAIALLENAVSYEPNLGGDLDQTRVYRAINAMDGGLADANDRVREVLGEVGLDSSAAMAENMAPKDQFRHHLLLRSLWVLGNQGRVRQAYLDKHDHWKTDLGHPWELINCYRAILLCETGKDDLLVEAFKWFDAAIEITKWEEHGATMRLIGAAIASVAFCFIDNSALEETATHLLTTAEGSLPHAGGTVAKLRSILGTPSPGAVKEALLALPFNYH